ncbi:5-formyltetrahydrofolate cyclo-ligase [Halobacillus sp. H74]|uniref:5-formyltetrahydrofolate cyclo-ligase n=1 Tax=Halobacillus sp. H74 TaxID=3457436 RepID=UPI003FCED43A
MDKTEWRFVGKNILQKITLKDKQKMESVMYAHLFDSPLWKEADVVGVTLSQSHEWATEDIIEEGWKANKIIAAPKCIPENKQMQFYQLDDYNQLEKVYFGLKEPDPECSEKVNKDDIDLLLVPGLLFDERGYRIGYGGGYYDRFIEGYLGKTVMIASEKQKQSGLPVEEFDQRVEYVLTENGIRATYTF